jgi:hypothetical protein
MFRLVYTLFCYVSLRSISYWLSGWEWDYLVSVLNEYHMSDYSFNESLNWEGELECSINENVESEKLVLSEILTVVWCNVNYASLINLTPFISQSSSLYHPTGGLKEIYSFLISLRVKVWSVGMFFYQVYGFIHGGSLNRLNWLNLLMLCIFLWLLIDLKEWVTWLLEELCLDSFDSELINR